MDVEPVLIPAKIIYNWDFRKYNVSKKAASFLAEFRTQPFVDLKVSLFKTILKQQKKTILLF